ncbi:hypothetical protein ACFYN0_34695 [Streptomyces sp. NPDC006704]|uniref:hypothetical protein n=1 Tax=unclassified Streptomyces TaxID=2593676 RepID=UPI003684758A
MPAPHAGARPQAVLVIVIVIVLAGVWLAARGADPTVVVQVLGGLGVSRLAAGSRVRRTRAADGR